MADIPSTAFERLAKLRRMLDAARAQAEGLQGQVDQARRQLEGANLGLEQATRAHRRLVVVGEGGSAYEQAVREVTSRPEGSAAQYVQTNTAALVRVPQFDADARAVHAAKLALAEVMDERRAALERAAQLRTAADGVEAALRARGWRPAATGEGLTTDFQGPQVANAVRPPEPSMFQAGARR